MRRSPLSFPPDIPIKCKFCDGWREIHKSHRKTMEGVRKRFFEKDGSFVCDECRGEGTPWRWTPVEMAYDENGNVSRITPESCPVMRV